MIKLRHLKKMVETGFQHPVTKKYKPSYSVLEYPSWWRKSKNGSAISRMKRVVSGEHWLIYFPEPAPWHYEHYKIYFTRKF